MSQTPTPGTPVPAASKDSVENELKSLVCAGTAGLGVAQHAIATDWRTAVAVAAGTGGARLR